jgi:hypothetical protein
VANLHPLGAYPSSFGLSPAASAQSSKINLANSDGLRPTTHARALIPKRVPSKLSIASDPLIIAREERRAFMRRSSAYEERALNNVHSALDEDEEHDDGYEVVESERRVNRGLLLGATHRCVALSALCDGCAHQVIGVTASMMCRACEVGRVYLSIG